MQFIKSLLSIALVLFTTTIQAQSAYLTENDKANYWAERLEIKAQTDSILNFSTATPLLRRDIVNASKSILANKNNYLTVIDIAKTNSVLKNNLDYLNEDERKKFDSKKLIGKSFYQSVANMYEVYKPDFKLIINPVIQYVVRKEQNSNQSLFLNSRGVNLRGAIANKLTFSALVTDNQERDPLYVQQNILAKQAVPNNGFYKDFKAPGGVDYFDCRGQITFNATKYINIAFGYDKNGIGNGYRSLFLSKSAPSALFLKFNTRIWRFRYQNLFMELQNAYQRVAGDVYLPKKYAAIHFLDFAVNKWMNIGLFEGIIFGRKNHFEFGYLNPVMFYRSIELQNGSLDNSVLGLNLKANLLHTIQIYGQFLLDDFSKNETNGKGYWANKWGIQIGAKYMDAFGIKNLDLLIEHNRVRPFTYSHLDSIANFTHFNQPLAHPLGANFSEFLAVATYRPHKKWTMVAKAFYYTKGNDSTSRSFGGNIFLPYLPPYRQADFGYFIGSGWKTVVLNTSLLISYEIKENLFIEGEALYRKKDTKTPPISSSHTSVISFGVRWNMQRRSFDN